MFFSFLKVSTCELYANHVSYSLHYHTLYILYITCTFKRARPLTHIHNHQSLLIITVFHAASLQFLIINYMHVTYTSFLRILGTIAGNASQQHLIHHVIFRGTENAFANKYVIIINILRVFSTPYMS